MSIAYLFTSPLGQSIPTARLQLYLEEGGYGGTQQPRKVP